MNPLTRRHLLYPALVGFVYGLFCRLVFTFKLAENSLGVMTIGFLMVMPLAVGFISVFLAVRAGHRGAATWVGLPVITTVALLVGSLVLFWEGIICLALLMPIAVLMALLGGAVGGLCASRFGKTPLVCVAILPFVVSAAERWVGSAYELREVETSITIQAPPATVWEQIRRVPPIQVGEQRFSWSQKIGFPRPIEATISGDGVGAVRHATFAGGVLFVETVTDWEPQRRLAFDIRADTVNIPPNTLDEHVTIGGPYFDALHGEYRIDPQSDGRTLLRLTSRHR
jgi:Polyketide cyclase / dehydrase and lipid transport